MNLYHKNDKKNKVHENVKIVLERELLKKK